MSPSTAGDVHTFCNPSADGPSSVTALRAASWPHVVHDAPVSSPLDDDDGKVVVVEGGNEDDVEDADALLTVLSSLEQAVASRATTTATINGQRRGFRAIGPALRGLTHNPSRPGWSQSCASNGARRGTATRCCRGSSSTPSVRRR